MNANDCKQEFLGYVVMSEMWNNTCTISDGFNLSVARSWRS